MCAGNSTGGDVVSGVVALRISVGGGKPGKSGIAGTSGGAAAVAPCEAF
jgi:hypothetical protein